jgi:hypothetical protein
VFARADYAWRRWRRDAPSAGQGPPPGGGPPPSGLQWTPGRRWSDSVARFLRKNRVVQVILRVFSKSVVPFLFALMAAAVGIFLLPFFQPKFLRQAMRRRRYRPKGGPSDTTPTPRIPRTPLQLQPDVLAKEIPAEHGADAVAVTREAEEPAMAEA